MANVERILYSRRDAAFALGISLRTVATLIANGTLKTRRIGSRTMIPAAEVRRIAAKDTPVITK